MKKTKRFSIRYKLIIVFGLLIAIASSTEGFLATRTARSGNRKGRNAPYR